jgi:hypothetical protein
LGDFWTVLGESCRTVSMQNKQTGDKILEPLAVKVLTVVKIHRFMTSAVFPETVDTKRGKKAAERKKENGAIKYRQEQKSKFCYTLELIFLWRRFFVKKNSADYSEISANYSEIFADYLEISADYSEISAEYSDIFADY